MYGEVISVEQVAPRMKRIRFGGDGLADFVSTGDTDEYVNAQFLPPDSPLVVPFDLDAARSDDDPAQRPKGRRYTIRNVEPERGEIVIDFVVHGDVGYAGSWARQARPGDRLQMLGPSGGYRPDPDAAWYLMIGDESALPAIARSLEHTRAGVPALAVVIVDDERGEVPLHSPGDLRVVWVHRMREADDSGSSADRLVEVLTDVEWPDGDPDVFVHGEAAEVRAVRHHVVADRGVERDGASISPYWRRGLDDEAWREVKRQFIADMEADA